MALVSKNTRSQAYSWVKKLEFLGPRQLLMGDDPALHDELINRVCAAINPIDIIEEIYVSDITHLQWEIERYRAQKQGLLKTIEQKAVERLLYQVDNLAEFRTGTTTKVMDILHSKLSPEKAEELAERLYRGEQAAADEVTTILAHAGTNLIKLQKSAKADADKSVLQRYARQEADARKHIDDLLAERGLTLHEITAEGLAEKIDSIERLDRLITNSEMRRNDSLREIERRRAAHGFALWRQNVDVEEAEVEMLDDERLPQENGDVYGKNAGTRSP